MANVQLDWFEGNGNRRFSRCPLLQEVLHSAFPDINISKYGSVYYYFDGLKHGSPRATMTRRRIQHRLQPCARLRALASLDGWRLASAGVETKQVVSVGPTKWTVCYALHVIPTPRTQYKASITLWPRAREKRQAHDWHPYLLKAGWYEACRQQLRQDGYRGSWARSPYGRFGDFWKSLRNFNALAREARLLQRLRRASFWAQSRRTSRLSGPA